MTTLQPSTENDIASLKNQLKQLQEQRAAGTLSPEDYDATRTIVERRLLDLVLAEEHSPQGALPPSPAEVTAEPPQKLSLRLLAMLGLTVLLVAGAGYSWMKYSSSVDGHAQGQPGMGKASSASGAASATSASGKSLIAPHSTDYDQIAAMTDKLAQKLKANPQNGAGWAMLARSYGALGNDEEAIKAYEKAVALVGENPVLLADYADALALKNKAGLAGEPMKLVERALKSDPANTKALSLSGSYAFERKDYKEAIRLWEKVVQIGPAEDPVVEQAQTSLTDARALVGIPPLATADTSAKTVAAPGAATVGGVVKLSPALLKQVKPEDTLFVFARAAEGSRMPLAIVRKQVKDLPYTFTLDDSTSMSPNAKLSTSGKVIVGARISKSGNAIPAAGDLSGQSQPTSVGAKDLSIEISEVVKL